MDNGFIAEKEFRFNFLIEFHLAEIVPNNLDKENTRHVDNRQSGNCYYLLLTMRARVLRQVNCAVHVADNLAEELYRVQ